MDEHYDFDNQANDDKLFLKINKIVADASKSYIDQSYAELP